MTVHGDFPKCPAASHDRCNSGDVTPRTEGSVLGGTAFVGSEAVATKLEVIVDPAVGGKETLRMTGGLEVLHMPSSSSCRLV